MTRTVTASVLADGRKHLEILSTEWPRNDFNPAHYTTVRNIDGSNRFMRDGGGWSFLPSDNRELMDAVRQALADLDASLAGVA